MSLIRPPAAFHQTKWLRALALAVVLIDSIVLAPGVAAQKGAGGLPPAGTYQFTSASTDFSSFAGNTQVFLNVSSDTNVSQPVGAPPTTTSETQVFLNLFDYSTGTFTSACLMLDHPSDFTINKDLTMASLTTTLTPATPTCPFSSPLTTTIGLNGTWTGVGPLATTRDESTYQCGSYTLDGVSRNLNNSGSANLSLTIGGTSTQLSAGQVGLNSNTYQIQAQGLAAPGCGLTGFGTGPVPAGKYHIFGLNPNAFFGMPPGPTNQISLFENNNSSQPDGGTATTSQEFDLSVSMFGGAINGYGCWIISPSDVTSTGVTSASIQTTITAQTPNCSNTYPGFGINYPLTVSVAWTTTGPIASVHDVNSFGCAGYTEQSVVAVQSNPANSTGTVTMPDYLGNPTSIALTGGMGAITYVDQRIHAKGVEPQACMIRG
jgi:hypothetical protein